MTPCNPTKSHQDALLLLYISDAFKPTKTFLKEVLELLLDVLEMLLDVLDLSCMSWTCPGGTRTVRMATILPS